MLSRIVRRRLVAQGCRINACSRTSPTARAVQRRWMTPAPKPGDGPLMSRRADRELPDVREVSSGWRKSFPIFLVAVAACAAVIFNYQKSSSPIISSTMYALRTSPKARELLGDEIYFKHQIPWIGGEMNQLKGRIDISFTVKGTRGSGTMRFASFRPSSKALFQTTVWSLTTEEGVTVDLLDGQDPFTGLLGDDDDGLASLEEDAQTRGFRQQGALNR